MLGPKTYTTHGTQPCNTCKSQNTSYNKKKTHPCNTFKSQNITYIRKRDPYMQYLHIKCNLHWKREPINAIPTYQMQFTLEKMTIHAIPTCQMKPTLERDPCI
jgi:hypothetical protein